jgi:hypothetical protein
MVEPIDLRYVKNNFPSYYFQTIFHSIKDVYEFIQRRSDWKKIEKIVDKTMYSLSFKEDCIIS